MHTSNEIGRLSSELERATLRALLAEYHAINHEFFKASLKAPPLSLIESAQFLGAYIQNPRGIQLAYRLVLKHPWGTVVEVLKHEMAHQFVTENLGNPDGAPHGPVFRKVCAERGFDGAPEGIPSAGAAPISAEGHTLERIAKLLALAESPNQHEAQAAMSAARRLMLKYNLSELITPERQRHSFRQLGEPTGRVNEAQRILANILSDFFFVECIWVSAWRPLEGKRGSVLEILGSAANLEIAEYVHHFLMNTAERLWAQHKSERKIRGDRDRRAFIAGVMNGFHKKLDGERQKTNAEGLVWVGDPGLAAFFKRRHPRVSHVLRYGSSQNPAHQAGQLEGAKIVLHRGVKQGPSGTPKLLK